MKHANAFGRSPAFSGRDVHEDFGEQLYDALRRSPWWMTSLAVHALVFLVLTLVDTSAVAAAPKPQIEASFLGCDMPEEDPLPTTVDTADVHFDSFSTDEPVLKDEEIDDHAESDDDLRQDDSLGKQGTSDAPFDGPIDNGTIGIGGNAGSPFGRPDGGGDHDGRPRGGCPAFEEAVDDALRWLAAHQSPDGRWEAAGFRNWCDGRPVADPKERPQGEGRAQFDPGVTGLALCAFLGAGYTNRGKHPFAKTVSRGLRYLKAIQDPEGCFGPRSSQRYIYNHAIAALAMVEAYGMTGSPIFRGSAQRALEFNSLARNPYLAWRYGVKPGDNDTSVSGWMMMALKSAQLVNRDAQRRGKRARLVFDMPGFDGLRRWLERVTDPDSGRVGYVRRGTGSARPRDLVGRFPAAKSEAMTAVGILARVFMGEDPRASAVIRRGAALCAQHPPNWNPGDGSIDMYYWYYGTLAMFQVGGEGWQRWRQRMQPAMVDTQRKDTQYCRYKGSWDPLGPWGDDGGRVYSTAAMAMCLEVYYRYARVFGAK